jgi:hypothetical protein
MESEEGIAVLLEKIEWEKAEPEKFTACEGRVKKVFGGSFGTPDGTRLEEE